MLTTVPDRKKQQSTGDGAVVVPSSVSEKRQSKKKRPSGSLLLFASFVFFEVVLFLLMLFLFNSAVTIIPMPGLQIDDVSIYQVVSIILVLGWVALLIGYFAWCTHFYNYNFGRSEAFWSKFVARVKAAEAEGKTENDVYDELAAPRQNPYADQTFGIPPGTVRGSLALTIVVGGLSLLISFFSSDGFREVPAGSILEDYFAFFKDAFLMVVAFYFGTRALDIMEKEKTRRVEAEAPRHSASGERTGLRIPLAAPARAVPSPAGDGAATQLTPTLPIPPTPPPAPAPTTDGDAVDPTIRKQVVLKEHYPHTEDLAPEEEEPAEVKRELEPVDFEDFAEKYDLEVATVRSVVKVESGGSGFLKDGRPKILFEGHIFWRELKKKDIAPEKYASDNNTILYPKWTRSFYKGGTGEYERLSAAKLIDEEAALRSASWGLFQIMGFHAEFLKYEDVFDYVKRQYVSEREHLEAFGRFIEANNLTRHLRAHQWAKFARGYNGPGYAQNKYDTKLKHFYEHYKGSVPA